MRSVWRARINSPCYRPGAQPHEQASDTAEHSDHHGQEKVVEFAVLRCVRLAERRRRPPHAKRRREASQKRETRKSAIFDTLQEMSANNVLVRSCLQRQPGRDALLSIFVLLRQRCRQQSPGPSTICTGPKGPKRAWKMQKRRIASSPADLGSRELIAINSYYVGHGRI